MAMCIRIDPNLRPGDGRSYCDHEPNGTGLYGHYMIKGGIGSNGSAIEKFKQVVDVINRRFVDDKHLSVMPDGGCADHRVASISFSRNCIVVLKKRTTISEWGAEAKLEQWMERYRDGALDPERRLYRAYRASHDWDVRGTPRDARRFEPHCSRKAIKRSPSPPPAARPPYPVESAEAKGEALFNRTGGCRIRPTARSGGYSAVKARRACVAAAKRAELSGRSNSTTAPNDGPNSTRTG